MMKRLKDMIRTEATIRVKTRRKIMVDKNKVTVSSKDLYMVSIDFPTYRVSTAFDYSKNGKNKLFNFIKKELRL